MSNHPTKNELSGFVLGMLPPESTDDVAEHLEQCPPCQETVCELDAHKDTLLSSLQQPVPPMDDACRQFVEKAKAIPAEQPAETSQVSKTVPMLSASLPSAASPGSPVPTRERFLAVLQAARLIDDTDWNRLQRLPAVAGAPDGAALGRALVEQGGLTKFQAAAVYHGKASHLVFGEYVVLDKIGAGGMGQVFKARHRRMDRIVALKVLAKAAVGSPDAVKRFQREVKAAAKLIHPNIVIAHDAGEQDGTHFLVMEFVPGSDLSAIVKRDGPLSIEKAIDYVLQAARGLAFAHGEGVVHRDIKPGNLLVDQKGIVRILDMGLARLDGDLASKTAGEGLTQTGAVMGTVDYMAPEQAFDTSKADAKADVYGLGCTLYRLLTGQNVFTGDTLVQKILAHREQPIPSLVPNCPQVQPQLDALYQRMVAKQPEDRPTMSELVIELEALAKQDPRTPFVVNRDTQRSASRGTGVSSQGSGKKPPSRKLIAAGAAGFLFVALGVWFIVRDKDGNEIARFKAPEGSTVTTQIDSAPKPPVAKTPIAALPLATVAASSIPQPELASLRANASVAEVVSDLPPWTQVKDAPPPALAPLTKAAAQQLQSAWAKYLGRSVVQENSLGMSLALIPSGEFDAVYTEPNQSAIKPEMTRRRVRISQAFDLGATEVTVAQFRQFVDATGYLTDAEKNGKGGYNSDAGQPNSEWTWQKPGAHKQSDDMPVVQVSWNDAAAFCEWLSKKEGARYRLPTEAEWEFACRAGSGSYHAVCEKEHELTQHAWVKENGSLGGAFVRPVGNWKANPFGLFDVLGNAWEWCADGGNRDSADWTHAIDPWGYFVFPNVRGCGFDVSAKDAHPAYRRPRSYDLQRSSIGFRVLRQLSSESPPGPLGRPLLVNRNARLFRQALVARPAPIAGLRSWSVELAGCEHGRRDALASVWSPQGDRIATSNYDDPMVRLWDRNGRLVQVLARHTSYVPRMTFSPDGKWLVTVGEDRYLIWNVATGACHAVIPNAMTGRPAFSPDGTMLAVFRGNQSMFQTLDLRTGRILGAAGGIVGTGGGAAGDYLAWSPDGKTIATVNVRDSISFHTAPGLERTERMPVAKKLYMLAWSPDGKWLAAVEHDGEEAVQIYDAESRALKTTLDRSKLDRRSFSLAWSKDSRRILEGGSRDRFFIIWDALTGGELLRSTGGGGPAAWSPDEQEIVVGGTPLRVFDAQTGLLKRAGIDLGRSLATSNTSISTDGERLFTREDLPARTISILNAQTGALLDRWGNLPPGRMMISPAKDQIAFFDKTVAKNLFVVDAATGKQLRELKPHPEEIRTVAWSPDGQQLVSGGKDKVLRIWNVADAKLQHELPGHASEIHALGWSPDGKHLASADADSVRLWDPKEGRLIAAHQAPGKLVPSTAALAWTVDSQALLLGLKSRDVSLKLNVASAAWSQPEPGPRVTGFFPSPNARHWLLSVENSPFMYRRGETAQTGDFLTTAFLGSQWHPDSRRFLSDFNGIGWIRGYDVEADRPLGVVMPALAGNNWLAVGPEGHYNGPKGIEDHLVYIAQSESGEHVTLSPAEFGKRYGRKNDAGQACLLGAPTTTASIAPVRLPEAAKP